ncbi:MAG: phospholipid carrier-dependent glycosyltransferase [Patescibacteria group bacterium]|nr:phospholipid carrier-dependent glycosyltransferase [Patescibacteria group bacterium]
MQKTIKVILAFIWLAVIGYFFYFQNHLYYLESLTFLGRIIPGLIAVAIVLIGAFLFKKTNFWIALLTIFLLTGTVLTASQLSADLALYSGNTLIQDELGWGMLAEGIEPSAGMTVMVEKDTIVGSSSKLMSALPAEIGEFFAKVDILKSVAFVWLNLIMVVGFLALLTLAAFSIGHKILKPKNLTLAEFLMSTAIGIGIYMGAMFVLGLADLIYWPVIVAIAAIGSAFSGRSILLLIKKITTWQPKITPSILPLAAITVLIYNILDIIRPVPIGWDDTNYYLYIPEKIAGTHGLLDGAGGMYNWELFTTIASFTNSAMLPMFTNFWGGLLALAALYLVLKQFLSNKNALTLTSLFYILPAVIFQSSTDIKNDLPLLFFILMAVYAFTKKETRFAAIMLGIAVGIKATAAIAVIAMIPLLFKKKQAIAVGFFLFAMLFFVAGQGNLFLVDMFSPETIRIISYALLGTGVLALIPVRPTKQTAVFLGLIAATMLPWIINNSIIDGMPLTTTTYLGSNPNNAGISFTGYVEQCPDLENLDEELSRYITGNGQKEFGVNLFHLLRMPWQMTMNPGFTGIYLDISFIFLGLLPLFLWYLIEKNDKKFKVIATASAFYFLILTLFFNGVIWYGLAGICMLILLVGIMLESYEKDSWQGEKMLSLVVRTALTITAITVVFMKIASFGSIEQLAYLGEVIDEEKYIETIYPGVLQAVEIVPEDTHVLSIGGGTAYFFAGENIDFVKDETFDTLACLRQNYTPEEVIEIYRDLGIGYMAIDYTLLLEPDADDAIRKRYINALEFADKYLEKLVSKEDFALYKI